MARPKKQEIALSELDQGGECLDREPWKGCSKKDSSVPETIRPYLVFAHELAFGQDVLFHGQRKAIVRREKACFVPILSVIHCRSLSQSES